MIVIQAADSVDADLGAAVAALIPQLSSTSAAPTLAELQAIVSNPATTLLLAKEDDQVVGMLTLATFPVPTGIRAWIEDVVVDDDARGAGVASALVKAALEEAERQGSRTVDLTSRPQREAANRLYVRLGFERRETNVYRFSLET
ncbi:MAG TPA: GNAT family N-acetyltransferase [Acidimicrobiales bacterium]